MTGRPKGISIDAQGRAWRGGKRLWTAEEDQLLRDRYPNEPTFRLAEALGRPLAGTYQRARMLGLEKSEAYYASPMSTRLKPGDNRGGPTRFKKGQTPANKGLRRPGWFRGRMRETQFKPGVSTNWMPIGSRREIGGYVYIKLADVRHVCWNRNWFPEHIITWERHHGRQLPAGYAVCFKNGDRHDMRPENLEAIPRRELMRRNSIHTHLPPELVRTVQLIGAVQRQIRRRDRHGEHHRPPAQ